MSEMKLGLCVRDGVGHNLEASLAQAKKLGFRYVQIALWNMDNLNKEGARRAKELLEQYDLTCTEVWCGWSPPLVWDFRSGPAVLGLVPAAYRDARIKNLLQGGVYAKELGVTNVITHLGFIPQDPTDQNYVGLIIALKYITAEYAKQGLMLSLETGQETPVIARRCMEDVGAANIGINYDPANLIIYGNANPVDGLDLLMEYISCVHAKDATYPTGGYTLGAETPFGEGGVNVSVFIRKLLANGFQGNISIEHERNWLSEAEKESEIMNAKAMLSDLLK